MSRPGLFALAWGVAGLLASCSKGKEEELPGESDLYAYSLAVARAGASKAPHRNALGLFHIGKVHERFGLEDKALELYKQAIALDLQLSDAYRSTAFILSQRKDRMAEAIEAYQQALRTSGESSGILSRMGLVFLHMGRLDDALLSLDEEIRGQTADADTYYTRGQTLSQMGRQDEAASSYRKAIALSPQLKNAHYALAQSLRAAGKNEEAAEAEKSFRSLQEAETKHGTGRSEPGTNREELLAHASKTWLDVAALLAEESFEVKNDPAQLQTIEREYSRALREAMRLNPADLEPRKALIERYRKTGDILSAARECSDALAAEPHQEGFAQAAFHLSLSMLESLPRTASTSDPSFELARRLLHQAVEAKPDLAEAQRELARLILFRLEPKPELHAQALSHAQAAVKLSPDALSYDILALAYFKVGRRDLAQGALEEGLRKNPQDATLKKRLEGLTGQPQTK